MTRRNTTPNDRGKIRKTFDFQPEHYQKAEAILSKEKRPRSLTRLIEDLFEAEHQRVCKRRAAA